MWIIPPRCGCHNNTTSPNQSRHRQWRSVAISDGTQYFLVSASPAIVDTAAIDDNDDSNSNRIATAAAGCFRVTSAGMSPFGPSFDVIHSLPWLREKSLVAVV
ncbi:hypothetical protein PG997_014656 [Apiospora hydei]|uniref:Uncharacterized protein n=1 Tax=Apiospora hydei TaxID=1337664 RepID=A0ABR1UUF5_9PEZI